MGEFLKDWRRNAVRIVIGAVLAAGIYVALLVWVPYQREQRIAMGIQAIGGVISCEYAGPVWIPQSIRNQRTPLTRVTEIYLNDTRITDAGLENLKGLTNLQHLGLDYTKVTDAGLENLKRLTNLQILSLINTKVTDAGLENLKGLTKLRYLYLQSTPVTDEGRAMLLKALPNCTITPDP